MVGHGFMRHRILSGESVVVSCPLPSGDLCGCPNLRCRVRVFDKEGRVDCPETNTKQGELNKRQVKKKTLCFRFDTAFIVVVILPILECNGGRVL